MHWAVRYGGQARINAQTRAAASDCSVDERERRWRLQVDRRVSLDNVVIIGRMVVNGYMDYGAPPTYDTSLSCTWP